MVEALEVRSARFDDIDPQVVYDILRLRSEVFVVEQGCVFLDIDGRDVEAGTWHCWVQYSPLGGAARARVGPQVVSYLRVLTEGGGSSIGRVVTTPGYRHRGLASRLLGVGLQLAQRPVSVNAQVRLVPWYAGLGFARSGDDFVEDGILHTPMELA
ncbi:MAG: GNAT family N-acetyltransferase [Actinobacteria bacterium]|nr:GNAT family N-acetyltransferase [Actinomycetota bacterium]